MKIKKYPQTTTAYQVVFINTDTNEVEFESKFFETLSEAKAFKPGATAWKIMMIEKSLLDLKK